MSTVPLKVVGMTILNGDVPSVPVRLPSQVAPAAQASAAFAGVTAAGTATSSSPAVATAATARRVMEIRIFVLIYGSSLGVGAPGL